MGTAPSCKAGVPGSNPGTGCIFVNLFAAKATPESMTTGTQNLSCPEFKKVITDISNQYKRLPQHHKNAKEQVHTLKNELMSAPLRTPKNPQFMADDQKKVLPKQISTKMMRPMARVKQAVQIKLACGTTEYELL